MADDLQLSNFLFFIVQARLILIESSELDMWVLMVFFGTSLGTDRNGSVRTGQRQFQRDNPQRL